MKTYNGPFPAWSRPSPEESRAATESLVALHGAPKRVVTDPLEEAQGCHGQVLVLDSLVRTMLSQNTTDLTSIRAFKSLKARFPTWEEVLAAPDVEIESAIRVGGLAQIKTQRMKVLLKRLQEQRGQCCLEWLRNETTESIKSFLGSFPGVGPKTVSCVLLFCLHRPDFPVDTHVHHISKSLGWVPPNASREQTYEHLNLRIPDDIKFELHVLLVEHGKVCGACSKGGRAKTKSHACPLAAVKRRSTSKQHVKVNSSTDGAPTQPPKGSDTHDKKRQRLLLGEDE